MGAAGKLAESATRVAGSLPRCWTRMRRRRGLRRARCVPEIGVVAVPSTTDGGNMDGGDFEVTASWGHFGSGQAVMPGQGRGGRASVHVGGEGGYGGC